MMTKECFWPMLLKLVSKLIKITAVICCDCLEDLRETMTAGFLKSAECFVETLGCVFQRRIRKVRLFHSRIVKKPRKNRAIPALFRISKSACAVPQ